MCFIVKGVSGYLLLEAEVSSRYQFLRLTTRSSRSAVPRIYLEPAREKSIEMQFIRLSLHYYNRNDRHDQREHPDQLTTLIASMITMSKKTMSLEDWYKVKEM